MKSRNYTPDEYAWREYLKQEGASIEDRRAFLAGYREGYNEGNADGWNDGHSEGWNDGFDSGYTAGEERA